MSKTLKELLNGLMMRKDTVFNTKRRRKGFICPYMKYKWRDLNLKEGQKVEFEQGETIKDHCKNVIPNDH